METAGKALGLPRGAQLLLKSFVDISTDLDLHSVLVNLVESACAITEATYGAMGVIGPDDGLADFVTHGMSDATISGMARGPAGEGLLGELMVHPQPLRLDRLHEHPSSCGFPPGHPPMTTFLGVPVRIRGTVFGNLYLTEKAAGASFTEEDEVLVRALATAAGFVIENARTLALSERRRQWLEATMRVNERLQRPFRLAGSLERVAVVTRTVMGAAAVVLLQRDASGRLALAAADGPDADRADELVARFADEALTCGLTGLLATARDGAERTVVLVPFTTRVAAGGVMLVLLARGQALLENEERQLLSTFVDHACLGLDRARALEDREQLALVSDRERIARDLHELVIERIFATGLRLHSVRRRHDEPALSARLDATVEELDATIRDIRSTIFARHNDQEPALSIAVKALIADYVPVLGFAPTLRTVGPVDGSVPSHLATHLLAVLRESLSNVARHARATMVTLDVEVRPAEVLLRVADDGVGLQDVRTESGLGNVRRRAHELGGTVWLHGTEPHGTTVLWRVPLLLPHDRRVAAGA